MDREALLSETHLKHIYLKMLDYLGRGDMSEERLIKRITRLKLRYPKTQRYEHYTREYCLKVLPLLREEGYIDEERFARRVVDGLKNKHDGIQVIRRKLMQRDVDPKVIESVMKEFKVEEHDLTAITNKARQKFQQISRKVPKGRGYDQKVREKLYAWLSGRGFTEQEISFIIADITREKDDPFLE